MTDCWSAYSMKLGTSRPTLTAEIVRQILLPLQHWFTIVQVSSSSYYKPQSFSAVGGHMWEHYFGVMDGEYFGPSQYFASTVDQGPNKSYSLSPARYFASTVDQGPNKSYLLGPAVPDFPSRWILIIQVHQLLWRLRTFGRVKGIASGTIGLAGVPPT